MLLRWFWHMCRPCGLAGSRSEFKLKSYFMPKRKKHLASLASARKVRAALASQANTPTAGRASPGTSTSAPSSLPKGYKTWNKSSTSTRDSRIYPVKKFRSALDEKLNGWDGEALFRRTFRYYNGSFGCAKNVRLLQQVYGNSTALLNTVRTLDLRTRVDEHGQPLGPKSPLKAAATVRERSAPDRLTPWSQASTSGETLAGHQTPLKRKQSCPLPARGQQGGFDVDREEPGLVTWLTTVQTSNQLLRMQRQHCRNCPAGPAAAQCHISEVRRGRMMGDAIQVVYCEACDSIVGEVNNQ